MLDGAKKRPKLEIEPGTAPVVQRMFKMAESGKSILDIARAFNGEGIASPAGKRWSKTVVHKMLNNETYTGTLVWGVRAADKAPPVRVEDAFPGIVSQVSVQARLGASAVKGTVEGSPQTCGKFLHAQRLGQVQELPEGTQRTGR